MRLTIPAGEISRVTAGAPVDTAFTNAFPHAGTLGEELSAYVGRFAFTAIQITFSDRVKGASEYTATRMTPAESLATTGLVLA